MITQRQYNYLIEITFYCFQKTFSGIICFSLNIKCNVTIINHRGFLDNFYRGVSQQKCPDVLSKDGKAVVILK